MKSTAQEDISNLEQVLLVELAAGTTEYPSLSLQSLSVNRQIDEGYPGRASCHNVINQV